MSVEKSKKFVYKPVVNIGHDSSSENLCSEHSSEEENNHAEEISNIFKKKSLMKKEQYTKRQKKIKNAWAL